MFSTDPDNVFHENKNLYKILPFQCKKQQNLPESWPLSLTFDFFTFLFHFKLDPDPKPAPEPDPEP
jgi:hypothetical protein